MGLDITNMLHVRGSHLNLKQLLSKECRGLFCHLVVEYSATCWSKQEVRKPDGAFILKHLFCLHHHCCRWLDASLLLETRVRPLSHYVTAEAELSKLHNCMQVRSVMTHFFMNSLSFAFNLAFIRAFRFTFTRFFTANVMSAKTC